jgi:hypothetical protein
MRSIGFFFAALALGFVLTASAAEHSKHRYKWKDAQGNLHFDDALPIEALQFGYDEVNSQGIVVKHVDRTKTAEETKAEEDAAASQAAQQHTADEQATRGQQLLAAYPDERDLVSAQQAQMDVLEQNIHTTQISLSSQEKSLTELLSHAADIERGGKPVPAPQQQQIDVLRRNIEKQKAYIARKQQEKPGLTQKFADELAHYRELRAKSQR